LVIVSIFALIFSLSVSLSLSLSLSLFLSLWWCFRCRRRSQFGRASHRRARGRRRSSLTRAAVHGRAGRFLAAPVACRLVVARGDAATGRGRGAEDEADGRIGPPQARRGGAAGERTRQAGVFMCCVISMVRWFEK
jgi:hypothetical protein